MPLSLQAMIINYYYRCTSAKLDAEGVLMYTHLLCVGTNLKLCMGNVEEALDIGEIISCCYIPTHAYVMSNQHNLLATVCLIKTT